MVTIGDLCNYGGCIGSVLSCASFFVGFSLDFNPVIMGVAGGCFLISGTCGAVALCSAHRAELVEQYGPNRPCPILSTVERDISCCRGADQNEEIEMQSNEQVRQVTQISNLNSDQSSSLNNVITVGGINHSEASVNIS